jgi:PAS domain S-box-containing protein
MKKAEPTKDESGRLEALWNLEILDTAAEDAFDSLVKLAASVCGMPIALISLVDRERQWFKANVGLEGASETPRDLAFCAHAIHGETLFEICDAEQDERFFDNPLVTGAPHVGYYAGVPLRLSSGHNVGTLCVIDHKPNVLGPVGRAALQELAKLTARMLEFRKAENDLQKERSLLAEERRHLMHIVQGTGAGTWEYDFVTGEDRINDIYAEMLGFDVDAMVRKINGNFFNIVHPDDRLHVEQAWNAHLGGMTKEYEAEFRVQHHNGYWVWILSRGRIGTADATGKALNISGIHLDISSRHNAIELAHRAVHDMENTLNAIPSRVVYWDKNLNYRFSNTAFKLRFERNGVRLDGMHMRDILGEPLYQDNLAVLAKVDHGEEVELERSNHLEDGVWEHYLIRYKPDFLDGSVQGYYVFVFDITEMKIVQEQLEQVNIALQERTQQAESASVSKSAFLATMSHEIRTPMHAILGMHALIQKTSLTPKQLDYLRKSERAAKSLLGLLNDLLDFSKVEAGKMALDPVPFRTDDLLDELSVIFSSYVGNKPVEVLLDVGAGLPEVMLGDSLRLKQVLINLGGNAIKFTESGTVVIRAHWKNPPNGKSTLAFSVKDSGIGIAPEHQLHIFEGFSQAEASTSRRFGGTGLGLAISKSLVEMMGGTIALESALGLGSTFSFEVAMPVVEPVPPHLKKSGRKDLRGMHVLVIDDTRMSGELLRIAGRSLGWVVDVAASGVEGIQRMLDALQPGQTPYSLILVDWQMPDMDGWETARQIRACTSGTEYLPKLVMVSANGREMVSHRTDAEQAMLDAFLTKPVTPAMLSSAYQATQMLESEGDGRSPMTSSSLRRLSGLNILVVEDNLINQQVAEELLHAEGAKVSLAANGELGVQAIMTAHPPYDVVLMDIQMPVMDGHTATRKLRASAGFERLPIIGLTANALRSDYEDSIAAGMNEHIGKPFDIENLVAAVLRLTRQQNPATAALPTQRPEPREADNPAALGFVTEDIDLQVALQRMSGMQSTYLRAARDFHASLNSVTPDLHAALSANNFLQATALMHTFKGTAATLGLMRLSQECGRLEILCKKDIPAATIGAQATALEVLVRKAQQALEDAAVFLGLPIPALDTAVSAEVARVVTGELPEDVRVQLHELIALLRGHDLTALEKFAAIRTTLMAFDGASAHQLENKLQGLELEAACAICEAWIQ